MMLRAWLEHESGADVLALPVIEQDGSRTQKMAKKSITRSRKAIKDFTPSGLFASTHQLLVQDTQISQNPHFKFRLRYWKPERDEGEVQAETVLTPRALSQLL